MSGKDFYRNAKAYDIAFSDRDFETESNFLIWSLENHSNISYRQFPQKTFLELGCGPAQHVREFARRGWNSVGLDLSEDMIKYAMDETKKEKIEAQFLVGDMCDFQLDNPVVLSATLMESISHLVTNEQMISHFRSVAKNMVSGGIYVIEATHPMFFFPDDEPNTWTSEGDGMKVDITFGVPSDSYNTITQQWLMTTKMKITESNGHEFLTETKTPLRWYLAQEMKALIELSGVFDEYWFYGSLYSIPPFELDTSENSDAMVIVLRVK